MSQPFSNKGNIQNKLHADCENCFGLCCVALPYAKSADFAWNKDGGTPCRNLQTDYRCGIHKDLRKKGFRGCAVYECFGAGQTVSQVTYDGNDWKDHPSLAKEMFDVFPIMQQLHEMLYYLNEALHLEATVSIHKDLQIAIEEMEYLTNRSPKSILDINVSEHRATINTLLLQTSELVRADIPNKETKINRKSDLFGADLRGVDLRGANLRGAFLIAANLRKADLRETDLIGADFRDADLSGANLEGCLFLTQAQVNAAIGDGHTKLPASLRIPDHWDLN